MKDTSSWYFSRQLKPCGPVSTSEMKQMILRGEIGPQDLISAGEDGRWLPAEEWGVFEKSLFPATQQYVYGVEVDDVKEWVLLGYDAEKRLLQEGPYSLAELKSGLQQSKIRSEQFVWKAGLTGWSRIADRPEFGS